MLKACYSSIYYQPVVMLVLSRLVTSIPVKVPLIALYLNIRAGYQTFILTEIGLKCVHESKTFKYQKFGLTARSDSWSRLLFGFQVSYFQHIRNCQMKRRGVLMVSTMNPEIPGWGKLSLSDIPHLPLPTFPVVSLLLTV